MIRPCPNCNSEKVEVIGFGYEIWDNVQDSIGAIWAMRS